MRLHKCSKLFKNSRPDGIIPYGSQVSTRLEAHGMSTATNELGVKERLFGELAARAGLVTEEQIAECLALQQKYRDRNQKIPRLGEILASRNYLYIDQVKAILRGEFSDPGRLYGEMAVQMGFLKQGQVNECLRIQKELEAEQGDGRPRLGAILHDKAYLKEPQLRAVLEAQKKPEEAAKAVLPAGAGALVAPSADEQEVGLDRSPPATPSTSMTPVIMVSPTSFLPSRISRKAASMPSPAA